MAVGQMRQDRRSPKGTDRRKAGQIAGQAIQNRAANAYTTEETAVPVSEAARVLGVDTRTVRWMCAAGKLRAFLTAAGHWQVFTADLDAPPQGGAANVAADGSSQPSPIFRQGEERVEELALTVPEKKVERALQQPEDPERRRVDEEKAAQRAQEIEMALDEARKQLPYSAQGTYSPSGDFEDCPSKWDIRARHAAADAIRQLGNDASFSEIRTVAIQAGKRVVQEYRHHQACERVVSGVWLPHGTASDDQVAREAVRQALEKLPVGSSQAEMEEARDAVLACL